MVSLWRNVYSSPYPFLKFGYSFLTTVLQNSLYILETDFLPDIYKYSSHFIGYILMLLVPLLCKTFQFNTVHFYFSCLCLWYCIHEIIAKANVLKLSFYDLTFNYLIQCELINVYDEKVQFYSFACKYTVFPAAIVEEIVFFLLYCLYTLVEMIWCVWIYFQGTIRFHCSVCLFLCQYHSVQITVTL